MKELFPGYYKRNIKEIEELWKTAIFVFDTNLLTSLYKHSKETRDAILDQIEILKDRIILPYHAAYEFNKNRYKVIFDQQALFDTFIKNINIVENEIKSVTKHPFLSKELSEEAFTLFDKLKEQVNIEKTFFIEIFKNDIIYDKISDLFFGKISEKFSDEIIEKIHEEGEKRYAAKIPPGYKDEKKVENKFGDLIIWKHIIEIGKKAPEKGIIFISDDRKEDWIWSVNGKDIGARPELAEEISKEANSNFSLLDVLSFIKLGGKFSDTQPSVKAINEIEAFKNQELLEEKRYNTYEEYYKKSNIDNWNGYIPPSTITDFNPLDPNNFLGRTTTGYDPNEFKLSSTGYNPLDPNNFLGRTTTGYDPNEFKLSNTGYNPLDPNNFLGRTTTGYDPNEFKLSSTGYNPLDPNNFLGRTTGYDPNEFKVSSTGYNPLDPNNFLGRTTGYEINDQIIKKNKSTDEK